MPFLDRNDARIYWCENGSPEGEPVLFAHPLGTHSGVWNEVIEANPALQNYRLIRFDIRGHGKSSAPKPPYTMGTLIADAESLIDFLKIRNCVFVGAHIGGQIAQSLAVKRLDQVRALCIVNTAAKIGIKSRWDRHIAEIEIGGLESIANDLFKSWFSRGNQATKHAEFWKTEFLNSSANGYIGCCAAMSGTDFYTPVSSLRLSTLGLSAFNDTLIPPDLMRDTMEVIHGSDFQIIPRAAHLSMIEQPIDFGNRLTQFLESIGHHRNGACSTHSHDHVEGKNH